MPYLPCAIAQGSLSDHQEFSGLVLSMVDRDGKPQNVFLDLEDVYNLNLPVDLVVLSACNVATANLMGRFYDAMLRKGLRPEGNGDNV
jgi:CHAT domain-containing protein